MNIDTQVEGKHYYYCIIIDYNIYCYATTVITLQEL